MLVKIGRQPVKTAARDAEDVAQALDEDIMVDCVICRRHIQRDQDRGSSLV